MVGGNRGRKRGVRATEKMVEMGRGKRNDERKEIYVTYCLVTSLPAFACTLYREPCSFCPVHFGLSYWASETLLSDTTWNICLLFVCFTLWVIANHTCEVGFVPHTPVLTAN